MTRLDLLKILIGQARTNGFDFKYWYTGCLRIPWEGQMQALDIVPSQRRYYALLFHHDFAKSFWKPGEVITFQVPATSFDRQMPDGSIQTVQRKPFMRRTARPDAWRYHLREMALAEEPLRYMRRYVNVEDEFVDDSVPVLRLPVSVDRKVPVRPAQKTLALARKAAERRQRELAALPPLLGESKSKRGARVPGSR
jgi:hypothetical protein